MWSNLFRKKSLLQIQKDIELGISDAEHHSGLKKVLGLRDLTFFGMAAIIGAGIFSTIGTACADGGPAIIWLFIGITIACGFSALCYAEMASRIPVSGSVYTYSYTTFGELIAWIIGWDLIMEYAVGNVTVAIAWSGNFTNFLEHLGIHLPQYLCKSFMEVKNGHDAFIHASKHALALSDYTVNLHQLWLEAPRILGLPLILNLPAFFITAIITALVYIGIKESRNASNAMVIFKVFVVIMVIVLGAFYVQPSNWIPFAPNGTAGILKGTSAVFFAYIGFDALATTAEECKNPQRDIPRAMLLSLLIATTIYIAAALVLTGMVPYYSLKNEAFLANAFLDRGIAWISGLIAFSALIATASVLLVFQMGQPRIWMVMSRDGLLPKKFAQIHPKYHTPKFATIITGLLVGIPALLLDAAFVTDMCSIGTLFAFVLVCAGVMVLQNKKDLPSPKFKIPYWNSRWAIPVLLISLVYYLFFWHKGIVAQEQFSLAGGYSQWKHLIPIWIFYLTLILVSIKAWKEKYSLIPYLGLLCCCYLLSTLGIVNWIRFIIWLIIGLLIYLAYGYKNSKLHTTITNH